MTQLGMDSIIYRELASNPIDPLRMYILVNASIKLSPNKIATQIADGVSFITEKMVKFKPEKWQEYHKVTSNKVILWCSGEIMSSIYSKHYNICHQCLESNISTVLVFEPLYKKEVPEEIFGLRLY